MGEGVKRACILGGMDHLDHLGGWLTQDIIEFKFQKVISSISSQIYGSGTQERV